MILKIFNFKTHRELLTVPRESYLDKTHFFSFFLKYIIMSSKILML
jgi:hypothetical protein